MVKKILTQNDNEPVTKRLLKEELGVVRSEIRNDIRKDIQEIVGGFAADVYKEMDKLGTKIDVLSDEVKAIAEGLTTKVEISDHKALEKRVEVLEGPKYIK